MYNILKLHNHLINRWEVRPTKDLFRKDRIAGTGTTKKQCSILCVLFLFLNSLQTTRLFISHTLADYFCHPVLGKQWEHINNKRIWITTHVPDPRLRKCVHGGANHLARPALAKLGRKLYESILEKYVHETMQSFIQHIQDCDLYPKTYSGFWPLSFERLFWWGDGGGGGMGGEEVS